MSRFIFLSLICVFLVSFANSDIINDAKLSIELAKCRTYCQRLNPKYDEILETCYVIEEKKLIVVDCEAQCLNLSKEELDNAKRCKCIKGECKTALENGSSVNKASVLLLSILPVIIVMIFLQK